MSAPRRMMEIDSVLLTNVYAVLVNLRTGDMRPSDERVRHFEERLRDELEREHETRTNEWGALTRDEFTQIAVAP